MKEMRANVYSLATIICSNFSNIDCTQRFSLSDNNIRSFWCNRWFTIGTESSSRIVHDTSIIIRRILVQSSNTPLEFIEIVALEQVEYDDQSLKSRQCLPNQI